MASAILGAGCDASSELELRRRSRLNLVPVIADLRLVGHNLIEVVGFLDEDVASDFKLAQQYGLQAHKFEHREEGADQRSL